MFIATGCASRHHHNSADTCRPCSCCRQTRQGSCSNPTTANSSTTTGMKLSKNQVFRLCFLHFCFSYIGRKYVQIPDHIVFFPKVHPNPAIASNAAVDGKGKPKRIRPTLISAPLGQSAPSNGLQAAAVPYQENAPIASVQPDDPKLQQRYAGSVAQSHQV